MDAAFDRRLPSAALGLILAAAAMCWSSCAYFLQGQTEEIAVNSEPPEATVTLSNGDTGVTPFTIEVPRERDLVFHFSKPGYRSTDVLNEAQVQSGYITADWISTLLTVIPFAWMTDVSSGAAHTHEQTMITGYLTPDPTYAAQQPAASITPAPEATPTATSPPKAH